MKTCKKILFTVFMFTLLLSITLIFAGAASESITEFAVICETDETQIKIEAWQSSGDFYLFLPSDADLSALTVDYTASCAVTLNGEEIENGEVLLLDTGSEYVLACGESEYGLKVFKSAGIPSLHITTESGSMAAVHADKSYKEPASIVIVSDGEIVVDKELEYIKGRGNFTWALAKKPYNIKFDKKIDLFGMGKAKKWTLLANYVDNSIMRNYTAFDFARTLGLQFTSNNTYVDLYIDNEYYGNYLLCESVEVGETRVDITDLEEATEDANPDIELDECELGGDHTTDYRSLVAGTQKWVEIPNDPEDITGGYLLEYELPDRYVNEVCGFVTNLSQTIVLKAPEYASEAQVKYISALYQEFEDAVYSASGYNSLGKHYTEYIDVESFVRMYVFQEFVKNLDAGITSYYIYKDSDSDKFVAAPVWDFDKALGYKEERYGINLGTPTGWWGSISYHWSNNSINTLPTVTNALYQQDDFFALACAEWNNVLCPLVTDEYINSLSDIADTLTPAAVMNAIRWNNFGTTNYDDTASAYKSFVKTDLMDFIYQRRAFLNKGFSETSVRVLYKTNGGTGNMFNEGAPQIGDKFTIPACSFAHSTLVFDCWNTKADGSGTSYSAGETITLTDTKLVLYAQWTEKAVEEPDNSNNDNNDDGNNNSSNLNFFQKIIEFLKNFFNKISDFFGNLFK